jgi:alpha-N-arabinofuranosidase
VNELKYTNPIIKGFYPDPSVCFDGKFYYLVCSSFEYYPGIPVFKSDDLINWQHVGSVFTNQKIELSSDRNSSGLFAPTIRFHQGIYYVVCTNITQGNFICHTKNPEEEWSEANWIDCPMGIDPSLTFTDEKCYYQLAAMAEGMSIIQFEINPFTGEILSEIREISQGCGGRDVEAPHVYKKDNAYYLLLAEGGTREGHMVTIQKSDSIWGPYQPCPYNPILTNRNIKSPLQAVGHADLFSDNDGNWWSVSLATRPKKHFTLLGRETILLPVIWDDVWPVINESGTASIEVSTDKIQTIQKTENSKQNYFTPENIRTLRLPTEFEQIEDKYVLQNYPQKISLANTRNSPVSFISISQKGYQMKFQAKLNSNSLQDGTFGLIIYKDDSHYAKFGLRKKSTELLIFAEKQILDIKISKQNISQFKDDFYLELNCDGENYNLSVINANRQVLLDEQMATRHFCNEVADSPFTGVQIGLFSEAIGGYTTFEQVQLYYF